MKSKNLPAFVLLAALFSGPSARADMIEINAPTDLFTTGIGDLAAVGGSNVASAFGKLGNTDLLSWQNSGVDDMQDSGASFTVGDVLGAIDAITTPDMLPVRRLVFGVGVNEPTNNGNILLSQFQLSVGGTDYFLNPPNNMTPPTNTVRVFENGGGQNLAEAFFAVNLGFDLRSLEDSESFSLKATITDRDGGGQEVIFLSEASAVPEPSSLMLTGLLASCVLLRRRRAS